MCEVESTDLQSSIAECFIPYGGKEQIKIITIKKEYLDSNKATVDEAVSVIKDITAKYDLGIKNIVRSFTKLFKEIKNIPILLVDLKEIDITEILARQLLTIYNMIVLSAPDTKENS